MLSTALLFRHGQCLWSKRLPPGPCRLTGFWGPRGLRAGTWGLPEAGVGSQGPRLLLGPALPSAATTPPRLPCLLHGTAAAGLMLLCWGAAHYQLCVRLG